MSQNNKWQREANIIHQQYLCMPKEANQKEKKMTMLGKKNILSSFFFYCVVQRFKNMKKKKIQESFRASPTHNS